MVTRVLKIKPIFQFTLFWEQEMIKRKCHYQLILMIFAKVTVTTFNYSLREKGTAASLSFLKYATDLPPRRLYRGTAMRLRANRSRERVGVKCVGSFHSCSFCFTLVQSYIFMEVGSDCVGRKCQFRYKLRSFSLDVRNWPI